MWLCGPISADELDDRFADRTCKLMWLQANSILCLMKSEESDGIAARTEISWLVEVCRGGDVCAA